MARDGTLDVPQLHYEDLGGDACPEPENTYIDDGTLADSAEPESEILGTSARTERLAYERRMRNSVVLPGTVRLVTARR